MSKLYADMISLLMLYCCRSLLTVWKTSWHGSRASTTISEFGLRCAIVNLSDTATAAVEQDVPACLRII